MQLPLVLTQPRHATEWQLARFINRWRGLLLLTLLYVVFAVAYAATIAYSVQERDPTALPNYLRRVVLLDYPLKAVWTIPVWWLLFRGPLRQQSWATRLWAHVALGPLWVACWFGSYYGLLRAFGLPGLTGSGRVWEIYIPTLFYGVQFGLLHGFDFVQQLRQRGYLEQQLREQAHQSELSALKAQINPHFLFNTLNSISASVPPELETTRELIAQLAHTFRFALAASRYELLPLREELDFLRAYLALEQARFGTRLHVCIDVDEDLLTCLLPPMLLQPLVENAMRHGLAPSVAGATLTLSVKRAGPAAMRLTVTDTGKGPTGAPAALLRQGTGVGLRNTHTRLLALGSAGLELTTNQPHGLQVSFVLPLSTTDATVPSLT